MRWPAFGAKACQGATGFRHRAVTWALGIVPANNPIHFKGIAFE